VPTVATPAERFADVMDHEHTRDARDPLRELISTASDQPDTWVEGAMHFLQEDSGEAIAEEVVALVDRT
jgi:haloalkane dehalogenase